ncbi:adenine phosphoribosyltransferase [Rudaeicoccus suwonensis]|uniref:Adenine phosphoribosyltransferase n=1 Tax=Rudaeicoccus suwonensis TaxID=657409 RepID=A0A561EBA0_9MICO|nr:adenine phosphoribosyltransferase [Rudaeicoccus suwonensis]TWE12878.1 adenine phosphoribosyltransferase [Rudaeicoccus suwonensis]
MTVAETLAAHTAEVPDFPKAGVLFKDFNPLFAAPAAFAEVLEDIAGRWRGQVDVVAGVEARGFILGAPLAQRMDIGFVPIRKVGKLPGETVSCEYDLEYGSAVVEVAADAFADAHRVLLVDDVLATGGTAAAACELIERAGGRIAGIEMLLELRFLAGRDKLDGYVVNAIQVD